MKNINIKKLVLLNLPYVLVGLYATKLGQAWRLAEGINASEKLLHIMDGFAAAFQSALPSFHPSDLLVGLACGAALRLAVYQEQERQEIPAWAGVRECQMGCIITTVRHRIWTKRRIRNDYLQQNHRVILPPFSW